MQSPLLLLMLLLAMFAQAAQAESRSAATVVEAFGQHDLVAISEVHRSTAAHSFLDTLIESKAFQDAGIQNIVVEFGNAKYQALMDRYVAGEAVDNSELRDAWRNTTQFLVWDSPLYARFFGMIRRVNASRSPGRRLRVLLADPPIDWSAVHSADDYARFEDRDLHFARVIEREVLGKNEKALLVFGGVHLLSNPNKSRPLPEDRQNVGEILRRRHPGKFFAFWSSPTPLPKPLDCLRVCALSVAGTGLADKSFGPFAPRNVAVQKEVDGVKTWVPMTDEDWPRTIEITEGLIYFADSKHETEPDAGTYNDGAYLAELRRRAVILTSHFGLDYARILEEQLASAGSTTP